MSRYYFDGQCNPTRLEFLRMKISDGEHGINGGIRGLLDNWIGRVMCKDDAGKVLPVICGCGGSGYLCQDHAVAILKRQHEDDRIQ